MATHTKTPFGSALTRRRLLRGAGVVGAGLAFPHLWIPRTVQATAAFGTVEHLLYVRLADGFRFPVAFNGDTAPEYNPWGLASGVASGTQWGVGALLDRNEWRTETEAELGMKRVPQFTNDIAVIPCVDHEPLAGSADGNHQTGLERFLTGSVSGDLGLFTMINYGLRERMQDELDEGIVKLPAIVMGNPGMGLGFGVYGAHRPAVLRGDDFDRFSSGATGELPDWARGMAEAHDLRVRDGQNPSNAPMIDAYIQSREATRAYSEIFSSDILKIGEQSGESYDGVSNADLAAVFGDSRAGRDAHMALRLFHFGSPAVYFDQGGYDFHSDEEENLPGRMEEVCRLLSGLEWALKRLQHPTGGTYWDHTVVAFGSEFSRSTRGGRFNSARGSDHGGDLATRWMSMPFMGGPITAKGRTIGRTDPSTLASDGPVFSYRSMWKTMLDVLGCDHSEFFPADDPFEDLFV
jgi:hypothetical protein